MDFKTLAVITAVLLLVLGLGYLAAGTLLVGRWGIEPTVSVLLLGRRIGALYLGLSVMFFLARRAPVSVARTALSAGAVLMCALLALLGVAEFAAGHAGPAILASAALEFLLAVGYICILVLGRRVEPEA